MSEGTPRTIGGLAPEFQDRVLDSVIGQELSVRQTEELVRRAMNRVLVCFRRV